MPVFTVTSINTATEEITAAGHGLLTGDRFRLHNVNGASALPAATPSLAHMTTYFAIRTGTDTLKIATSSANALAGTAVDITGSSSPGLLLEYGLPYCEPRVAAPGSQIYSADDNAAWDAFKALHALHTGQTQSTWTDATFSVPISLTGVISPSTLAAGNTNDYAPSGYQTSNVWRVTPDAGGTSTITGVVVSVPGRLITIHNIGAVNLSFAHDSASSSANNRFFLPASATLVIGANGCATFWWDSTSTRWRLRSKGV